MVWTVSQANNVQPKYLWFLMMSYVVVILLANWFDVRLVRLFSLITDAGTLIFPLTFLLSNLITEVYGYKNARLAIWCGFLFNLIFIVYGQLVVHMPSPHFNTMNPLVDHLYQFNVRIIAASMLSYFCSEPANSFIVSKLKLKFRGQLMLIRFVFSTFVASGLDSFIFSCIAFYGTMTNHALLLMIMAMWLIKVVVEFIGAPFSIWIVKKLKRAECLDVYDWQTTYNLFSINSSYSAKANQYHKMNK